MQQPLDVKEMHTEELLTKAGNELLTSFHRPVYLTLNFLPHLKSHSAASKGSITMNVSSVLGISLFSIIKPVSNVTKSWYHFWTTNLRTQLSYDGNTDICVTEIVPPSVGTDLHHDREGSDDNKEEKDANGLTIDEFMMEVAEQLGQDKEVILAGMGMELVDRWYSAFGGDYKAAATKSAKSG